MSTLDLGCFLILVCFTVFFLTTLAARIATKLHAGDDQRVILLSSALPIGGILSVAIFRRLTRRRGPSLPPMKALSTGVLTFLVAAPVVFLAEQLSDWLINGLGLPAKDQEMLGIWQNPSLGHYRWLLFVSAAFLAPLAEENIFRGALFRYFRTRLHRWVAILLPALLFGVLHVQWNSLAGLPSLVPLVALATVFTLAYERTGDISTCIVAHALFNLNTFMLLAAGFGSG